MRLSFQRESADKGHHRDNVEQWMTDTALYERVLYGLDERDDEYTPEEVEAWIRDAPFIKVSGEGPVLLCPNGHDSFRIGAFVCGDMPLTCVSCGVVMEVALDDIPDAANSSA